MNFKKDFNEIYKSYLKSVIKKSLMFATIISCTVLCIISFTFWMIDFKKFWIALIVFGILEIAIFFIAFLKLRPTDKKLSKKLDGLGLQERVITMHQYQNDDSLMAQIQRKNAIEHIKSVNKKLVKLVTPVVVIVLLCITCLLGTTTTAMAALSSNDIIRSGYETLNSDETPTEFELTYDVVGEGFIEGELFQLVEKEKDSLPVLAIPEEGWMFVGWSIELTDGTQLKFKEGADPYHIQPFVTQDLVIYAVFIEVGESEESEEESDKEGQPSDNNKPQEPQNNKIPPKGDGDGSGKGGQYDPHNFIYDGKTYYGGETFDTAYNDAMNELQNDSEISDSGKETVSDYFTAIEK